jgi:hypothetical protein
MTDETTPAPAGGLWAYIVARLGEPGTWKSFGTALAAAGLTVDMALLTTAGLGLHALIGIFTPDQWGKK